MHETTGTRRYHQMTHAFWSFAQVIEHITLALERSSSILRPLWSETARHSRAGILGLPAAEEVNDTQ